MLVDRLRRPIGAAYAVNTPEGGTEIKRDYKKAMIDACIIAAIAAISVLMAFGFPPEPEAFYAMVLAFILAFFTSLGKRFDIVIKD